MMAVALVGAGEAIASRVSTGDTDVDEAGELMIDLFWRGLKEAPGGRDGAERRRGIARPVRPRRAPGTRR